MKSLFLIAATAALALSGCGPAPSHKTNKTFHVGKHQVHHFADGRVGYQDDAGIWWFLIMQNNTSASTPTLSGGWEKGTAPTASEIEAAEVQSQGVVETDTGEPVDAAEAAAVEAADPGVADVAPEAATGEISATVEFGVSAEGSVGDTSVDTGSVDTGSYDSGGSFDSGGGGDAGGGGGE